MPGAFVVSGFPELEAERWSWRDADFMAVFEHALPHLHRARSQRSNENLARLIDEIELCLEIRLMSLHLNEFDLETLEVLRDAVAKAAQELEETEVTGEWPHTEDLIERFRFTSKAMLPVIEGHIRLLKEGKTPPPWEWPPGQFDKK